MRRSKHGQPGGPGSDPRRSAEAISLYAFSAGNYRAKELSLLANSNRKTAATFSSELTVNNYRTNKNAIQIFLGLLLISLVNQNCNKTNKNAQSTEEREI